MQRKDTYDQARRRARVQAIAALAAVLAGALLYPMLGHGAPALGSAAPDFVLKSTTGHNLRLSEYRGDVVVIAFWGSWCGPCRDTLPRLGELAASQAPERPVLLGVSLDKEIDRAAAVADSLHLGFPTLVDTRQVIGRLYDVDNLPLTLLVDRDGRVRGTWAGETPPMPELARQIKELQRQ